MNLYISMYIYTQMNAQVVIHKGETIILDYQITTQLSLKVTQMPSNINTVEFFNTKTNTIAINNKQIFPKSHSLLLWNKLYFVENVVLYIKVITFL